MRYSSLAPTARGLRRELARAGEHRLDVGGGSLLAANLGLVDCVVDGQDGLVFRPERAQVEAASAEVVLAIKPLGEVAVGTRGCGREWFRLARVRFRVQVRVRVDLGQDFAAELLKLLNLCRDLEVKQRVALPSGCMTPPACLTATAPSSERRRFCGG